MIECCLPAGYPYPLKFKTISLVYLMTTVHWAQIYPFSHFCWFRYHCSNSFCSEKVPFHSDFRAHMFTHSSIECLPPRGNNVSLLYLTMTVVDVDECSSGTPCNTGACTNTPGTFTCDCTGTGFEGDTCQNGKAIQPIFHWVKGLSYHSGFWNDISRAPPCPYVQIWPWYIHSITM